MIAFIRELHSNSKLNGSFVSLLISVFTFTIIINVIYFISQTASPIIRSDAWRFLDLLVKKWATVGFEFFDLFYKRHIFDHAQPINKLILFINYKFLHLDFRVDALIGFIGLVIAISIFVCLYFNKIKLEQRSWLSGMTLVCALLVFTSMNVTVAYTWPLVTFGFIYLALAIVACLMTWSFANNMSTVTPLIISVTIFFLIGDTLTVIIWVSLVLSIGLVALHENKIFRIRTKIWITLTAIFVILYFILINNKFFFNEMVEVNVEKSGHLISWLDPVTYLELLRIVFSSALIYEEHFQALGSHATTASWIVAITVLSLYMRFFVMLFLSKKKIGVQKFIVLFLLIYVTIIVFGIAIGRTPLGGIDYLNQTRYIIYYQLIPFALIFDACFSFAENETNINSVHKFTIAVCGILFISLQLMYIVHAYKSIYWLSQYRVNEVKAIGSYLSNEPLSHKSCSVYLGSLCKMSTPKRHEMLRFLENRELNIFNSAFQWRYRLFPFDSQSSIVKVMDWGPKSISENKKTVWIKASQLNALSEYVIIVDNIEVLPVISSFITFTLPNDIIGRPGNYHITLIDKKFNSSVHVGTIKIK